MRIYGMNKDFNEFIKRFLREKIGDISKKSESLFEFKTMK